MYQGLLWLYQLGGCRRRPLLVLLEGDPGGILPLEPAVGAAGEQQPRRLGRRLELVVMHQFHLVVLLGEDALPDELLPRAHQAIGSAGGEVAAPPGSLENGEPVR